MTTTPADVPGIDHVVILVRDLDAAEAAFRRLGFHPTPRGFHSIGTQNHCLMFGNDYLELLSVVTPHPVTAYFSDFLTQREGAAAIAFASGDADATWRGFVDRGIAADPPVDFARPVERPDGNRDARFRVVQLPVDATPGCRAFVCQHFTPELVWLPAYQRHPLGVTGISGVDIVSADPEGTARAYARVVGSAVSAVDAEEGSFTVKLRGAVLRFGSREGVKGLDARIDAVRLRVSDLDGVASTLAARGIPIERDPASGWRVAATEAMGVRVVLVGTGSGRHSADPNTPAARRSSIRRSS